MEVAVLIDGHGRAAFDAEVGLGLLAGREVGYAEAAVGFETDELDGMLGKHGVLRGAHVDT